MNLDTDSITLFSSLLNNNIGNTTSASNAANNPPNANAFSQYSGFDINTAPISNIVVITITHTVNCFNDDNTAGAINLNNINGAITNASNAANKKPNCKAFFQYSFLVINTAPISNIVVITIIHTENCFNDDNTAGAINLNNINGVITNASNAANIKPNVNASLAILPPPNLINNAPTIITIVIAITQPENCFNDDNTAGATALNIINGNITNASNIPKITPNVIAFFINSPPPSITNSAPIDITIVHASITLDNDATAFNDSPLKRLNSIIGPITNVINIPNVTPNFNAF